MGTPNCWLAQVNWKPRVSSRWAAWASSNRRVGTRNSRSVSMAENQSILLRCGSGVTVRW